MPQETDPASAAAQMNASYQQRIITLDALRGFAVMGILTMNIVLFAMPEMAYFNPAAFGTYSPADMASWTINFILFDGKMRGLFSLLFGASMMLIVMRAEERGENAARIHFSRMGWLALFGLLHFYFIWHGDILFLYALAGIIAYFFIRLETERLIILALIIYVIGFLLTSLWMGSLFWLQYEAQMPSADAAAIAEFEKIMQELNGDNASEIAIYQSGYAQILNYRLTELRFGPLMMAFQNIMETLPFMLIGMALLKNGFIAGIVKISAYRKWAMIGMLGGGGGYILFAILAHMSDYDPITIMNISLAWSTPFRLLMTIGYASMLILIIGAIATGSEVYRAFLSRVASAGRAAFTNYIGTSIVMSTIFYGYGFGMFGEVSRNGLWLYVFGGCALMLLWSQPWLTRFRYGPLEWLWRSLARGKLQRQSFR